jgi:redox-sensitive bicupin YhaK (pirin superfamily)
MTLLFTPTPLPVQTLTKGAGFHAFGIRGSDAELDPFLMIDHYRMSQPTFAPHPHAGFSAVTYMFDDAQTGFRNRDSLGNAHDIRPGDLHWTLAGAGVMHDEVPLENGLEAHGLQLFVNLAAARKHMPPAALRIAREAMPVLTQSGGARVKLGFGAYDDGSVVKPSVLTLPTQVSLLDVTLPPGSSFAYPVAPGQTALAIGIAGTVSLNGAQLGAGRTGGAPWAVRHDQRRRY